MSAATPKFHVSLNVADIARSVAFYEKLFERAPAKQRLCVCESNFFDLWHACADCYVAHGVPDPTKNITDFRQQYCAVDVKPTADIFDETTAVLRSSTTPLPTAFTDPIPNSTAVSVYFTPTITGSEAWEVEGLTAGGRVTRTVTSGTEIVATTKAPAEATKQTKTASTTGGANRVDVAVAGIVGLAGFVAIL